MKKLSLHDIFLKGAFFLQEQMKLNLGWSIPFGDFLRNHFSVLQFVEFCFIGALGTFTNYGFYALFRNFVFNDLAWFIGIIVSMGQNFLLNKWFVFESFVEVEPVKKTEVREIK